jgi:phage terminase large subunit-like protein
VWLLLAGRGYGKTRSGAEWTREQVKRGRRRLALVAPTAADIRDVIVEGQSGILAVSPNSERPLYEPSKRRLTWPNGAVATLYSAEEPDRLRGPQHDGSWCFVAGTTILTDHGEIPIEAIKAGDLVVTRSGLHAVIRVASRAEKVGTVRFADGRHLTGTAEHPVLSSHGWMRLSDLSRGAACVTSASSGVDGGGTDTGLADNRGISNIAARGHSGESTETAYIGPYGERPTEKFLRDLMCIIGSKIWLRPTQMTWSFYRRVIIESFTSLKSQLLLSIGLSNQKFAYAAATVGSKSFESSAKTPGIRYVCDVNKSEPRKPARQTEPVNIAGDRSGRGKEISVVSVVSTWEPEGEARVFNLTVERSPEYFANGVLVHNCDELSVWKYPEAWDMLMFGLRLGPDPRVMVTATPRPTKLLRELLADPMTVITRGSSYENRANLAPTFFDRIVARYEGTRLGRQEIGGELLEDVPGALWTREGIDRDRWPYGQPLPAFKRIVCAVDPAATSGEEADETGIVVAACDWAGHGYVLADVSGHYQPTEWARAAIAQYKHPQRKADRIVAEINNGGEMVENTIRMVDPDIAYTPVHASRGKAIRAEPVSALYEQGRIHHVGNFPQLEDQQCSFTIDYDRARDGSPDRVDALVWALTDLLVEPGPLPVIVTKSMLQPRPGLPMVHTLRR